jgi:uncharacterized protein YcbK (DUF882 family)
MPAYTNPPLPSRPLRWLRRVVWAVLIAGLVLPSAGLARKKKAKKRNIKRYHLSLVHVNTKEKVRNLWVIRVDPKNKNKQWVGKRARKRLKHFLRDWRTGKSKRPPERLLWYLYLVGQRFDSPVHIVSGYRAKERKGSRHRHGKAVDFRIPGVSPKEVWQYCKRFDNVGLGWYPNSKFVHMDVRDKSAYWVDDSGPGEESKYRDGVTQRRQKKKKKGARSRGKKRKSKATAKKRKSKKRKSKATAKKRKSKKRKSKTTAKKSKSRKRKKGKSSSKAAAKDKDAAQGKAAKKPSKVARGKQ